MDCEDDCKNTAHRPPRCDVEPSQKSGNQKGPDTDVPLTTSGRAASPQEHQRHQGWPPETVSCFSENQTSAAGISAHRQREQGAAGRL